MKKSLKKTLILFIFIIGLIQNYCFADVVISDPIYNFSFLWLGIIIIGIMVIIISLISFLTLKLVVRNEEKTYYDNNLKDSVEFKKVKIQNWENIIYILCITICIMVTIYISFKFSHSPLALLISLVFIATSIIFRNLKRKKVSYILFFFALISIGIIPIIYELYFWKRNRNIQKTRITLTFEFFCC